MKDFLKYFTALFIIGLINNFGYVIISVGAQGIATKFGEQDLMPLFTLMLVSFSIPTLLINFRYLSGINSLVRITAASLITVSAFVLMSICISSNGSWSFPISLVASLLAGIAQAIGECVNLGYIKAFPPDFVLGFSSGTGFAGIAGSCAWLICDAIGLQGYQVFIIFLPLSLVYWFTFLWVYRRGKTYTSVYQKSEEAGQSLNEEPLTQSNDRTAADTGNSVFSIEMFKAVWKNISFYGLNLCSVYFFEYCIITGFADRATLKYSNGGSFAKKHAFVIIQFCYQFGVWMSRSSLTFFKVERTWIVSVLQMINWVVWWLEAEFLFLTEWGEFLLTIWVGLMGGLAYVNTGYLILNSEVIPKAHKEASMNVILCLNNFGVILSTCFCLLLDNFIMAS